MAQPGGSSTPRLPTRTATNTFQTKISSFTTQIAIDCAADEPDDGRGRVHEHHTAPLSPAQLPGTAAPDEGGASGAGDTGSAVGGDKGAGDEPSKAAGGDAESETNLSGRYSGDEEDDIQEDGASGSGSQVGSGSAGSSQAGRCRQ
ncbi:unnamed protein product [Phytophthora lilii]|uniref:Unnamed protein product n=1 Tax=Phytophthora lilii TaxID=2077276 RepID=A0A9W7CQ92_9STRA|nr:unnamed protein product [Phytophthora lilii]